MKQKLNVFCPINTTSYGYVSSNFLIELSRLDYDLKHIPIGPTTPDSDIMSKISGIISNWEFFHDAACLKIWHQHGLSPFVGRGKWIGMPIFELEDFHRVEMHHLSTPDELIVPSNWAKNVILKHFPNRGLHTHVVPLGYDDKIFEPSELPKTTKTIFGNFGKWEVRKGHNILVDIFNKSFEKNDNVMLVMLPHNPFLTAQEEKEWISKYKNSKLGDKIYILSRQNTQKLVYNIMRQIHCGIFPSRAEGWNLEALELLGCGRHVIITDVTGHTEFCNNKNSHMLHMEDKFEPAYDGKFFAGQSNWRKFSTDMIDQAVTYMREIHQKNQNGELKINNKGIESAKKFTWKESTKKLHKTLQKII